MDQEPVTIDRRTRVDIARYFSADLGYRMGQQLSFLTLTWLTYSLAQSSLALGILGFFYNIPFLFLSPIAGVITDLKSRKNVLLIGYAAQILIAFGLVGADAAGMLTTPVIYTGALVVGIVAALTMPSLFAILKDFIKDEHLFSRLAGLAAANAKLGQIIASSVFGILYGAIAAVGTLFLSGVVALISLVATAGIRIVSEDHPNPVAGQSVIGLMVDGTSYVFRHRALMLLIMLTAVPITARGMIFYQLPAIVHRHFDSGHLTMGMLYAAGVCGGLVGGFLLQQRKHPQGIVRWSIVSAGMTSAALLGVYFAQHVLVAALAIAVLDMAFIFSMGIGNIALQIMTESHRRGRVLAFLEMCIYGFLAMFSLVSGAVSHLLGLSTMIAASAAIVAAVTIAYIISIPGQRKDLDELYAAHNVKPESRPL